MGVYSQWVVIAIVVASAVAVGFLVWRRWSRARTLHMNCPGCGKRLAYKAASVGRNGMCPGCGEKFTFPAGDT